MNEPDRIDQIVSAVERIVSRDGVQTVSMRAVAAEAGVSLRLVQYYGKTKQDLLTTALHRLSERSVQHWQDSLASSGDSPRHALEAFLVAALPLDEERRAFHRFGVSLEQLAITETHGIRVIYQEHLSQLAAVIAPYIHATTRDADIDLAYELLAFAHGLGSLVMTGTLTDAQAHSLIAGYLDRIHA
ncbi:TetR/AcrR family transcriptional regulator [Microbacterium sp. G2-8]|uniref:TetR/AcrR family transcriptional regulator n=1 Tax=Microbacterium sp. G2-8 TaxID=2842454 RepID=UPI001C895AAB|nr:TetR family transcriptional regulator [Microbacterium sp. G2-8]